MNYLTEHWSFDPFLILVIGVVAWHEIGLARLAARSRPERARQRRLRSICFYAGLAVLLIAVQSPLDYWADDYFFVHMIQHLLLMFGAPSLIIAGAPWQPLLDALPRHGGKAITREVLTAGWTRPLRAVAAFALRPWVAVVLFNVAVHIWLMHGSYLAAGLLFWLQFIPSLPFRITWTPVSQAAALLATNLVMWALAMAMGFLSSTPWYSVYGHIPGVTLPALADQQIGAGILWICGDFWAIPTMIFVVRRLMAEDGTVGAAVDRILGRGSARYNWASRGRG
jgi:cytochrome c oxidase assembly factor CtaG